MPSYRYVAKDKDGKTVKGTMEAKDNEGLITILRGKDLIIVSVNEIAARPKAAAVLFQPQKKKVKLDDLVVFSRQLSTMVSAGIPVVNALDILGEQVENRSFKNIILTVRDDIETGSSLSEGMAKHSAVFSELYVNMVKAGESSGMLDEILDRVASYLEKASSLQKKVRSALIYPAVVSTMALIITTILLVFVIPVFKDIYAGFGAGLPRPTQALITVSEFMRRNFLFAIGGFFVLGIIMSRLARTEKGRLFMDSNSLRLPIFGILLRKVAISKFTRTFSTLVKSGVPILTCLEIVGKTAGNKAVERAVKGVHSSIREGESIATPLEDSKIFPPLVVRMISVGEKTGELDKMLTKIADFYDDQIDSSVSGLTSMIEPLIIAFLGVVIGTIVICMFLPIFKMSTLISA